MSRVQASLGEIQGTKTPCVAKIRSSEPTPRGWRLVKAAEAAHIDAVIGLAMAAEMAERRPEPVQLLGWL